MVSPGIGAAFARRRSCALFFAFALTGWPVRRWISRQLPQQKFGSSLLLLVWRWRSLFFFSSRRRHTRVTCDWSSDVCSSDLAARDRRQGVLEGATRQGLVARIG